MIVYRIQTEDKNRTPTLEMVAAKFQAFTVRQEIGYWNGVQEASLSIEIAVQEDADQSVNHATRASVQSLAAAIKAANAQEAILLTWSYVAGGLV